MKATDEVVLNGVVVGHVLIGPTTRNEDGTVSLSLGFELRKDLTEAELIQATGRGSETTKEQLKKAFFDAVQGKGPQHPDRPRDKLTT